LWTIGFNSHHLFDGGVQWCFEQYEYEHDAGAKPNPNPNANSNTKSNSNANVLPIDATRPDHMVGEHQ
jgi:hypothetical protein